MELVIIGKKAGNIEDVILKTRDDVKVNKYKSIEDFIMETQSRHPVIDRIILMQDAYTSLQNMEFVLSSFSDYIQRNYPATRLVTLSNIDTHLELLANTFLSPIYAHICLERAKPGVIISIATEPIDLVKEKYERLNIHSSTEAIGEIIEEQQPEQPQQVQQTGKEKKGLFGGLFGKKKKSKRQNQQQQQQDVGYMPIGQGTGVEDFSTQYNDDNVEVNVEHRGSGGDYSSELYEDITTQYAQEEYTEEYDENAEQDVEFEMPSTVLGETSDWGESYEDWGTEPTTEDDGSWGQGNVESENSENNTYNNDGVDTSYENQEYNENYEQYEENVENYNTEEDYTKEDYDYDYEGEDNQSYDDEDTYEEEQYHESEEDVVLVESDEYNRKIKELGKQHVEAGKNIVVPKLDLPNRNMNVQNVDTEEVDTSVPDIFMDLENLEKQYEDANVKTVVKEKVVERVVEVNNGGKNTKNYKNGVRLIVVTGDRKTGVTRTALNLATLYSNRDNVLYVDFDTENHGSVSYIGIEDLVNAPEHVQNGIGHLKHERMLESLSYLSTDLKINCLTSLYGCEITEEQLDVAQSVIAHQTTYTTVIVDCPLSELYMLEDILVYSEVVICIEPYVNCVINTLSMLDAMDDIKLSALVSRHCGFVLTKGKVEELNKNLEYVSDIFSLSDKPVNWSKIPFLGKIKELGSIAERLW